MPTTVIPEHISSMTPMVRVCREASPRRYSSTKLLPTAKVSSCRTNSAPTTTAVLLCGTCACVLVSGRGGAMVVSTWFIWFIWPSWALGSAGLEPTRIVLTALDWTRQASLTPLDCRAPSSEGLRGLDRGGAHGPYAGFGGQEATG